MNFVRSDLAKGSGSRSTSLSVGSLILLLAVTSLVGCRTYLMATPNLYVNFPDDPFATVAPKFRSPSVNVMYATDRAPIANSDGLRRYGHGRSRSLEFGTCTVTLGKDWDTLERASRTHWRTTIIPVRVKNTKRIGQFPGVPYAEPGDLEEQKQEYDRELKRQQDRLTTALTNVLREKRQTEGTPPKKEAFIFIHGVNTSLEEAAMVMAQIWHFMGRQGVPMIYSWPAGRGILNYGYDRESGESTIYHLKQFLRTIARCSDLKKVHLIAHSRGTDVLMTALRELHIENRLATDDKRLDLKIANVILAAPDIDLEVSSQRLAAEQLGSTCKQLTVYLSQDDRAIAFARWLFFSSVGRLGGFRWDELNEREQEYLKSLDFLTLVDARVQTDFIGHAYFYRNPAVSSDLILLLRDGVEPGNGRRSLTQAHPDTNFWEIRAGYPRNGED